MNNRLKVLYKQLSQLDPLHSSDRSTDLKRKSLLITSIRKFINKTNHGITSLYSELVRAYLKNEEQTDIIASQSVEIQQLRNEISYLHEHPPITPLHIWNIFEAINEHDKSFHFPQPVTLRVQNPNDGLKYIEREFSPQWVVCIHSISKEYFDNIAAVDDYKKPSYHRRMKRVIYKVENGKKIQFKYYILNDDDNLDAISNVFDNLNYYLCVVSKKFIVNVGFYDLVGDILQLNEDLEFAPEIDNIAISHDVEIKGYTAINAFKKIKEMYISKVMFQKRVLCYKEDMGL